MPGISLVRGERVDFSSRWQRIRSKKSNLVLFFAGLALILLALVWRVAVAPAIKVVPTDIDMVRLYDGVLTDYAAGDSRQPARTDIRIEAREFNPLGRSTSSVAVLDLNSALVSKPDNRRVLETKSRFAIDRRTARQVPGHGSDMTRSGYCLIFPFNTPKADIKVWDPLTGREQKAKFAGTRKVNKVQTYKFLVAYGGQEITAPVGLPKSMTGTQIKQLTESPNLGIADAQSFDLRYRANNSYELLVEPKMGNLVATRDERRSIYIDLNAGGVTALSIAQVVRKLDFSETAASQAGAATFASDEIKKWTLQSLYIPAGYLLLGIACVIIGFFVDTGRLQEQAPREEPRDVDRKRPEEDE